MKKEKVIIDEGMIKTLAVGLLRISSTKQGLAGDSPDRQKEEIKNKSLEYNVTGIHFIELIQSASSEVIHPATQVINYCKDNPGIKYCFVTYIDRFTRGGSFFYQSLKSQLARYGVQLVDVGGIISTEQKNSLEFVGREYKWSVHNPSHIAEVLEAEKAHDEIRTILTRLIGSEIRYLRMGYWMNRAPEGYVLVRKDVENGKRYFLEPDPIQSKYILKMFELKIQGKSYQEIVDTVNLMGYRSRSRNARGQDGSIIGNKGGKLLTLKQVRIFLQKPIYALVSTHKWLDKPTQIHGTPIISVEMFNRANSGKILITEDLQVLTKKPLDRYLRIVKNNPLYPFKGYVMCSVCSGKLRASASRGKLGKLYPAYHCSRNHKYLRIPTGDMEDTTYDFVKKVKFTDDFIAKFNKMTVEELEKRRDVSLDDSISLGKRVTELKIEKQNLIDTLKLLKSPIAIQSIEDDLKKVQSDIEQLAIVRDSSEFKEVTIEELLNHCKYYVEHLEDLVFSGTDKLQNAAFFGLIFDNPPTYEELKSGTTNLAPLFKLNEVYKNSDSSTVDDEGLEPPTFAV